RSQTKDTKNWHQKNNHPTWQEDGESPTKMAKKQQTKTTKHTIEFSNNRPDCVEATRFGATLPA
ncbi:hypothetical protein ACWDUN_24245, partial [Mycobacterium sp. NPDC003323]